MTFDPFNPSEIRGHETRGQTIAHAAAMICTQLMEQGMPLHEISRLMLVGYIGMMKAGHLGDKAKAHREVGEVWDEVRPQMKDEKRIIEIV